jgi:Tol biopolymer transport system component
MKTSHLLLLGFMLVVASCRKVEIEPMCEPIPLPSGAGHGRNYVMDSLYFWGKSPNPNNPNEVVFVFDPDHALDHSLVKYNIVTHQKATIFEGRMSYAPSWGSNGWILLNLSDHNIYKIKDNGDSLTQLTFSSSNFRPIWKYDGTEFCYMSNPTGHANYYICDPLGNHLDTLSHSGIGFSWTHPRYSPSTAGGALLVSDLEADSMLKIMDWPIEESSGYGGIFVDSTTLVFSYKSGIYSIDIESKELKQLKESCNSILYQAPTYSPIDGKLLWLKLEFELVTENDIHLKPVLVTMNPDGSGEEEIEIVW